MRRTGHRILIDPRSWCEEARDDIVARVIVHAGDDHAAHLGGRRAQLHEVRLEPANDRGRFDLDQVVHAIAADPTRLRDAERGEKAARRHAFHPFERGEVELDAIVDATRGQDAALGVKAKDRRTRTPRLPEDVRAAQGRVAAEVDLDRRREPTKPEVVAAPFQEGGLGLVHLGGDALHPGFVSRVIEQANTRGVAGEGAIGERIDQIERER